MNGHVRADAMPIAVFDGAPAALLSPRLCDAAATAALLPFDRLVAAIARAAAEYDQGAIASPERMVVPLDAGGVLLSMPATAGDLCIHKLVTVVPDNRGRRLPVIHGVVTVCDATTGRPLCLLDGPEVTGRRTAAVSLLAIERLLPAAPDGVLLIGTGAQARHHLAALHALHPRCRVWVRGRDTAAAEAFCATHAGLHGLLAVCAGPAVPAGVQVVVTLTTATSPVYDEPARADRLVIGVGAFRPEMAEIGPATLAGSELYADDPAGARHEAGDLIRAGIDWHRVRSLASAVLAKSPPGRPVVFKSVGTAAWDLAAARVAMAGLGLAAGAG